MNSKTLRKLEYNKIISLLADHASSESGKQLCRSLLPQTELSAIEQMQEETAAAFTRIIKKGRPSFGGCVPVEASLKRLELGALDQVSFFPLDAFWTVQDRSNPTVAMRQSMSFLTVWIFIFNVLSL